MIEGVELTLWTDDGSCLNVDLSPMQTLVVAKILGLKHAGAGAINCYSDKGLQQLMEMKTNPLRTKEVD